ncbi:hypothetical protein, partial [Acetobacter sp.]|uniref:hypothetical protein n=1 Tax=Acetobacter sp. TaxID=440 RepID=UPI0039E959B2
TLQDTASETYLKNEKMKKIFLFLVEKVSLTHINATFSRYDCHISQKKLWRMTVFLPCHPGPSSPHTECIGKRT